MTRGYEYKRWRIITALILLLLGFLSLNNFSTSISHENASGIFVFGAGILAWIALYLLVLRPYELRLAGYRQGTAHYRDLLDSAPDAMALVDMTGRIILVNQQVEKLFGYSRREMVDRNIALVVPKHSLARILLAMKNPSGILFQSPAGMRFENRGLKKGGDVFPVDVSLFPVEHDNKQLFLIDIRDATKRKEAEDNIRRGYLFQSAISTILKIGLQPLPLEKQLESILDEIIRIPWFSLQKKGCIFLVESDTETLVMKAQRGMGESIVQQCSQVSFGNCRCGEVAEEGNLVFPEYLSDQYIIQIRSGEQVYGILNLFFKETHSTDKQEDRLLHTIADTLAIIIEHRTTDLERERLQEELIRSEKLAALGRMTANVAHEIRNPLTAIGGLARRMNRSISDSSAEKAYAAIIHTEAARLEKMLNSLLNLTKTDSIHPTLCDINKEVRECIDLFRDLAQEKLITIEYVSAELPLILIDPDKLHEILTNLINNAMEAMPDGGTMVFKAGKELRKEIPSVVIELHDSGKGVTTGELDRIFEPFYTSKTIGIGLGLAICKKIMEQHGGCIAMDSTPGQGTTVKLFFPY